MDPSTEPLLPKREGARATYSSDDDEDLLDLAQRNGHSSFDMTHHLQRDRQEQQRLKEEENAAVCAVFVVSFDTRKGNTLEWCVGDVDLTGVEFKSMTSGSHLVDRDFVYFRKGLMHYGISCFAKKKVDNASERGVRMRSVGVMCSSYVSLHRHQAFLERQVLRILEQSGPASATTTSALVGNVDGNGKYAALLEYYNKHSIKRLHLSRERGGVTAVGSSDASGGRDGDVIAAARGAGSSGSATGSETAAGGSGVEKQMEVKEEQMVMMLNGDGYNKDATRNEDDGQKKSQLNSNSTVSLSQTRTILEDGMRAAGAADALPDYYEAIGAGYDENGDDEIAYGGTLDPNVHSDMPLLAITHPAGSFSQFVRFFDIDVFVLWKFSMLQKRLLFFSRPPVGVICYRVYCSCLLASHAIPYTFERRTNPLFYVNVADINTLEGEESYVACTTERVFELKKHLYDLYVNGQELLAQPRYAKLIKPNGADRARFEEVRAIMNSIHSSGGDYHTLEGALIRYFIELNSKIFRILLEIIPEDAAHLASDLDGQEGLSGKRGKPGIVNRGVMLRMGLDPQHDQSFMQQLLDVYDVNAHLDTSCCLY
eukprot:Nk52_evm8s272 gene=Nk52_evmTU8s272